jgi:hypothetical protein
MSRRKGSIRVPLLDDQYIELDCSCWHCVGNGVSVNTVLEPDFSLQMQGKKF